MIKDRYLSAYVTEFVDLKYRDVEVPCSFKVKGNEFGFSLGNYDKNKPLIIDPLITWSTYSGGSGGSVSNIATDNQGNVYAVGGTASTKDISTSGAHQTSNASASTGGLDGFLIKYDKFGAVQWGTYLGGSADDAITRVAVDKSGNVYVCGYTYSSSGISSGNVHQTSQAGNGRDAFLARFSSDGKLQWSTYLGGGAGDMATGVYADSKGGVYVSGLTASDSGISTKGTFQFGFPGGLSNNFLVKFSESGTRKWGSYYGAGSSKCLVSGEGDLVYLAGWGGTAPSTNAFQQADGKSFLARFTASGSRVWGTFYGTDSDEIQDISTDHKGGVYLAGMATSLSRVVSPGICTPVQENSSSSARNAFISRFDSSGNRIWSTTLQGEQKEEATSVSADTAGNAYLAGVTSSQTMLATPGAWQDTLAGKTDMFLARFSRTGAMQWTSYFGGNEEDAAASVACGVYEDVFLAGSTQSDGMASASASRTVVGVGKDGLLARFEVPICAVTPAIRCINKVCANSIATYLAEKHKDSRYKWYVDGGSILTGHDKDSVVVRWDSAGNGIIKLVETAMDGCKDSVVAYIPIQKQPKFGLSGRRAICQGAAEKYTYTGDGKLTYTWSISGGNVTGSDEKSRTIAWDKTGYNKISIIATNEAGCSDTLTDSVLVVAKPKAFVTNEKKICLGDALKLGLPPVAGHSYQWRSIPAGWVSTLPQPMVKPTVKTTYVLTETDTIGGCSVKDSVTIDVFKKPTPAATGVLNVCAGTKGIYNTKPTLGNLYSWKSSGGTFQSRTNTTQCEVQWTVPGKYTLVVYETNVNGCTDSSVLTVKVNPVPKAYTGDDRKVCFGEKVTLGGNTQAGNIYSWSCKGDAISGTKSRITFTAKQNCTLYLTETDSLTGCARMDSVQVTVYPRPASMYVRGDKDVCQGSIYNYFADNEPGFTCQWQVTGGKILAGQGTAAIKVEWDMAQQAALKMYKTGPAGCKDSAILPVKVHPLPMADAGYSQSICQGQKLQLGTAAEPGMLYYWESFPSGFYSSQAEPVVNPDVNTTYRLSVINEATGCRSVDTIVVSVLPASNLGISGSGEDCEGNSSAYSVSASRPGSTYRWRAIGGTIEGPAIGTEAQVKWNNEGTGLIKVFELNANGCMDSFIREVTIMPRPQTEMEGPLKVCLGTPVKYTAVQSGAVYHWKVQGGKIKGGDSGREVEILWQNEQGTLELEVTGISGCTTTQSWPIEIMKSIQAEVSGEQTVCIGAVTSYQVPDSLGADIQWEVQGGTIIPGSGNAQVSVKWDAAGQGTISAQLTNSAGCSYSATMQVQVTGKPEASFVSARSGCLNRELSFANKSTNSVAYAWDFGDGSAPSYAVEPSHTYDSAGDFVVRLVARSATGCYDTSYRIVRIGEKPRIEYYAMPVCAGQPVYFKNKSSNVAHRTWYFGDGTTSMENNPVHRYPATGTYLVKLVVETHEGCRDSLFSEVYVNPSADMRYAITRQGDTYHFRTADSLQNLYIWELGDGTEIRTPNFSHTYANEGTYPVRLTIRNDFGCVENRDTLIRFERFTCEPVLYPNPVMDQMQLRYCLSAQERVSISVYNSVGQLVSRPQTGTLQESGEYVLSLQDAVRTWPAGVYRLELVTGQKRSVLPFVKIGE